MEGDHRESSPWPPRNPHRTASFPSPSSSSSPPSIRPWVLVLLFSIFILLFLPSIRTIRPGGLLKNGWDVLNFALVLFAILCGILSRNPTSTDKSPHAAPQEWGTFSLSTPPPTSQNDITGNVNQSFPIRKMRSSSSYPDLRQAWPPADEWRFSDDTHLHRRRPDHDTWTKTIPVDTFVLRSATPPRSTPPTPPPPPPPRRRTVKKPPKPEPDPVQPVPVRAAPPPPPPPPPTPPRDPRRHHRNKSVGDLTSALAQFYQKKRKKNSTRNKKAQVDDLSPQISSAAQPPPPPPPPPPPSSVFNKLFSHKKAGSKGRKIHSVPAPPPPPPPPPIRRSRKESEYLSSRPPTSPHSVHRKRPERSSYERFSLQPQFPVTPPPPATKTAAGDQSEEGRVSCPPSPDVNNKADMFIARFRAGLQLEKNNSIREKQGQPLQQQREPEEDEGEETMMIGGLFD